MSADNWRRCPFCTKDHHNEMKKKYGKISYDEFKLLQSKATVEVASINQLPIREDSNITLTNTGRMVVKIRLHCGSCGKEWKLDTVKDFE